MKNSRNPAKKKKNNNEKIQSKKISTYENENPNLVENGMNLQLV